jgi:hypothetical protein
VQLRGFGVAAAAGVAAAGHPVGEGTGQGETVRKVRGTSKPSSVNGAIPVVTGAEPGHVRLVDVVGGQVGQRTAQVVLMAGAHRAGGRAGVWGGSGPGCWSFRRRR